MQNHLPDHIHTAPRTRVNVLRILGLLLLAVYLQACTTTRIRWAASEAGVKQNFKDASPIVGTFENQSARQFGPKYTRLWELLRGTEGVWAPPIAGGTDYGDEVRISAADPGLLDLALLSHGKVRQTARMPYSIHGNHLHLRHTSDFEWLPLGFNRGSFDLAITGSKGGDLVAIYHYDVQAIAMLVANAADCSTVEFRFPRVMGKSE